ncbi:hypothetical protein ACPV3A_37145 [Paenibacillus sp. Dod16]|uniref:hypothetical protein n=1 Tax=Paenibacillus sp. Dod16 TaxID=3416392 RepID=UPI003CF570E6
MGRKRILENVEIEPKYLDINNWPVVLTDDWSEERKEVFLKRKAAVEMRGNLDTVTFSSGDGGGSV